MKNPKGIVFDLDGTLIDSSLDFAAIRSDLGLAPATPILEAIPKMTARERKMAEAVLAGHESAAVGFARYIPNAENFLQTLREKQIPIGIFTRNSRATSEKIISALEIPCDILISHDNAPAKPKPVGLLRICEAWKCSPQNIVYVGDYLYDLEAGNAAGATTILYTAPEPLPFFAKDADFLLHDFADAYFLLEKIFS